MEGEQQDAIGRQEKMVEELRRAELLRYVLQALRQTTMSYPEGHAYRGLIEPLQLDRALGVVEEDIRILQDHLIHPRGT